MQAVGDSAPKASATGRAGGRFRRQAILRVALMVAASLLLAYALLEALPVTGLLAALLLLLLAWSLFRLVEDRERVFAEFLSNIDHGDYSTRGADTRAEGPGGGTELGRAQEVILARLHKLNRERDLRHQYLDKVIEHVDVSLLCIDDSGSVEMANGAARRLLGLRGLIHTRQIEAVDASLGAAVRGLPPGRQQVVRSVIGRQLRQLLLGVTEFTMEGKSYRLVSLRDVKRALDEKELESWRKLIRVMSHEIMNSLTPIVSLSRYVESCLENGDKRGQLADGDSNVSQDLKRSVGAIHARSRGLAEFISAYRGFSSLRPAALASADLDALLEGLRTLFASRMEKAGAQLHLDNALGGAALLADPHALEQILINLLANALDAVTGRPGPRVSLRASAGAGIALLEVSDNGAGIPSHYAQEIFTPYFTTREGGSGIGLSLSRQLAQLNRGALSVRSRENEGSTFTLSLPLAPDG